MGKTKKQSESKNLYPMNYDAVFKESIIYLPLFHSDTLSATALFKESFELIKSMQVEKQMKKKLFALSMTLVRRIVDPAELEAFWEEVRRMGNVIIEFAESYGEKRGIKIGE